MLTDYEYQMFSKIDQDSLNVELTIEPENDGDDATIYN